MTRSTVQVMIQGEMSPEEAISVLERLTASLAINCELQAQRLLALQCLRQALGPQPVTAGEG